MFKKNQQIILNETNYRLDTRLGGGGQCEVWKAEQLDNQQYVAIRTVCGFESGNNAERTPRTQDDLTILINQLSEEIKLLSQFDELAVSNGILPVLATGTYQHQQWAGLDLPVMVQPYCNNGSLSKFDRSICQEECTFAQWWSWFKELIDALDYVHEQTPQIHRDIKPDNILLHDGHIALIDFGIARLLGNNIGTETKNQIGSVGYAPPEQWLPASIDDDGKPSYNYTQSADIYATAMTFIPMIHARLEAHILLNDEELENRHKTSLSSSGIGEIGRIGGMMEQEFPVVVRDITNTIGARPQFSKHSLEDASFAIADLLRRMLSPNAEARPTAKAIRNHEIPLIDSLLRQPRQNRLKIHQISVANHGKVGQGESLALTLQIEAKGMSCDGKWLNVMCKGQTLSHRMINKSDSTLITETSSECVFHIDVPKPCGRYSLELHIHDVPDLLNKMIECQRTVAFESLWSSGDYEGALHNEFRETEFIEYAEGQPQDKSTEAFLRKMITEYPEHKALISGYLPKKEEDKEQKTPAWREKLQTHRKALIIGIVAMIGVSIGAVMLKGGSEDIKPIKPVQTVTDDNKLSEAVVVEDTVSETDIAENNTSNSNEGAVENQPPSDPKKYEKASNVLSKWNTNAENVSAEELNKAVATLDELALKNDLAVNKWLGHYYAKVKQNTKAIVYHNRVAEQGDVDAQVWVASTLMYNAAQQGGGNAEINAYYHQAKTYAKQLAEKGNLVGMFCYGRILYDIDYIQDEGLRWLEQARELGYEPAKARLAELGQ